MLGGKSHVELRADFPGGFPQHTRSAFTEQGRTPDERKMFRYLRDLLHLRSQYPALHRGKLIHYPPTWNQDVYKYLKIAGDQKILVVANGHDTQQRVALDDLRHHISGPVALRDLLSDGQVTKMEQHIDVPPLSTRLLLVE